MRPRVAFAPFLTHLRAEDEPRDQPDTRGMSDDAKRQVPRIAKLLDQRRLPRGVSALSVVLGGQHRIQVRQDKRDQHAPLRRVAEQVNPVVADLTRLWAAQPGGQIEYAKPGPDLAFGP